MDIFIIEIADADKINKEILLGHKKKNISASKRLEEHCFVYFMVDKILEHIYKYTDREIVFNGNKPFLKSGKKFLSISHSVDYAALAFSDTECGIDIEKMTERDFGKIARRMNFQAVVKEDFYKEWTFYEAKYKLGNKAVSTESLIFSNYCVTACSSNKNETFTFLFQTINDFPKT